MITDFTENEARLYSITMLYIYIMAWMKCPSFNPDGVLRMRLVWIKHKKRVQDSIHSNVWPCLYGMDEETVIYLLDRRTKREEIISIEKAKWFEETDDKESFELKHERKEEVLQYIKKMPYNESIWKDLEKVWGFEIV